MAISTTELQDVGHLWGGDLQLSSTGDLARVTSVTRSRQRVLRRLLTVPGTYLAHPTYGAGLPARIGSLLTDPKKIETIILGQMRREQSVVRSPAPTAKVSAIVDGAFAQVNYIVAPTRQPATVSFSVQK